jgi:hypothetical protein
MNQAKLGFQDQMLLSFMKRMDAKLASPKVLVMSHCLGDNMTDNGNRIFRLVEDSNVACLSDSLEFRTKGGPVSKVT